MKSERIGIAGFRSSTDPAFFDAVSLDAVPDPVSLGFEGGAGGDQRLRAERCRRARTPLPGPESRAPRPALAGGGGSREVPMKSERVGIAGFRSSAGPAFFDAVSLDAVPDPVSLGFEGGAGGGQRLRAERCRRARTPLRGLESRAPMRRPALAGGGGSREVPMKNERVGIAGFRSSADPAFFDAVSLDPVSLEPVSLGFEGGAASIDGAGGCGRSGVADPERPSPGPNPERRRLGRRLREGRPA